MLDINGNWGNWDYFSGKIVMALQSDIFQGLEWECDNVVRMGGNWDTNIILRHLEFDSQECFLCNVYNTSYFISPRLS